MNANEEKRLLELCGLLCDERINEDEFGELDQLLRNSEEARNIYTEFTALHQTLDNELQPDFKTGSHLQAKEVSFPKKKLIPFGLAAAALGAAAVFLVSLSVKPDPADLTTAPRIASTTSPNSSPKGQQPLDSSPAPIATLTRAINVKWEHASRFRAQLGEDSAPGWLRIASGIAEITFASGASLSVEGPAYVRVDSPLHCVSKFGRVTANCPPSAYGFTIKFPGGKVTDLGTEFALNSHRDGATEVHVLSGEVIVARTNEAEEVVEQLNLTTLESASVDPGEDHIATISPTPDAFADLQRDHLIQSQPIKLQFDLGHRAGLYTGINSPAHAEGDMLQHESHWTQIVGDQSGSFVMADGNICPHPIQVDYGHGNGTIDWHAQPVDPWGSIYSDAPSIFNTALGQDHRPCDEDLAIRISGLPKGKYRMYALCRSARRPEAAYQVSFGVNIEQQHQPAREIPPMERQLAPTWKEGETYVLGELESKGPTDWLTFITKYHRDKSIPLPGSVPEHVRHGRSVLLGLQIVQMQ